MLDYYSLLSVSQSNILFIVKIVNLFALALFVIAFHSHWIVQSVLETVVAQARIGL